MKRKQIIIIGAGIGGLALSALLSKQGHQVTVIEKHKRPGGRAGSFKIKGFTFDIGPSWYLMPQVFDDFFKIFDKTVKDFYTLKQLNPSYQVFTNNQKYTIYSNIQKNFQLFNKLEVDGGLKLKRYLKDSEKKYQIAIKYLYTNFSSYLSYLKFNLLFNVFRFSIFKNMYSFTKQYFNSDTIHKLLLFKLLFLGSSPYNTPALYSILTHIDLNLGVWYPQKGMNQLIQALFTLSKQQGTNFIFNQEVIKIQVKNQKVIGVKTTRKVYPADLVINNSDYHYGETKLLDKQYRSYSNNYWRSRKLAPSAFIIFLGLNKKIENLIHHNLFIEDNWQLHFKQIDTNPKWPTNPCFYICSPSKTDSTVAPKGYENLFILVPIASNLKDTIKIRQQYSNKIISRLETLINQKITPYIVYQQTYSIKDFQTDYHAYQGTGFGLSHTLFQTAHFRPSVHSKKVSNLFYVGQYTQPGIGLPMCIISAQIVAAEIDKYLKKHD